MSHRAPNPFPHDHTGGSRHQETIIEICHPDEVQSIYPGAGTPIWAALDQAYHLWEQLGQQCRVRVLRRLNADAVMTCVCHFPPVDEPDP